MFRVLDKYAGRSKAIVKDNQDPLKKGRIKVEHPIVGITSWIPYLSSPATYDIPSIGDIVYVEADAGFYNYIVAWGNLTNSSSDNVNNPFNRRFDPTDRGMFTPGGQSLELDDGPNLVLGDTGEEGIRLITNGLNSIKLRDTFGTDIDHAGIEIFDRKANGLSITNETINGINNVTIQSHLNNTIQINESTVTQDYIIKLLSANGSSISIAGNKTSTVDTILINCSNGNVTISGAKVILDAAEIDLGAAAVEAVIKGNIFQTLYNAHTHISATPGNPTSPPVVPLVGTELSTKVKVE